MNVNLTKKKATLPLMLLIIVAAGIGYYVLTSRVEVDKEGGVTTKKDALVAQEVSYEKDGNVFKFTKNRVNRTAIINMQYPLADKDEYSDFMGSQVTMTPFMVNMLCGLLNQAFYEPEKLQEATKESSQAASITEDDEFKNALDGYRVSEFRINFKDKETSEPIASCQSSQKGFENIKFTVTRDYSDTPSFFNQQIGVVQKDENAQ